MFPSSLTLGENQSCKAYTEQTEHARFGGANAAGNFCNYQLGTASWTIEYVRTQKREQVDPTYKVAVYIFEGTSKNNAIIVPGRRCIYDRRNSVRVALNDAA